MLGLCFYVESKLSCGRQIRIDRWESIARSFEVDTLLIIDRTNFECFSPKADVPTIKVFSNLQEILEEYKNTKHVFIEKDAQLEPTNLLDYKHPKTDVIYFVGADGGGFRGEAPKSGDWIYIPTDSKYGMYAEQAALIVLADRYKHDHNR